MSLQLHVAIEIGETSASDAEFARLDHRESVIPTGNVETHDDLRDLLALAAATLDRMVADISERARTQLSQITEGLGD